MLISMTGFGKADATYGGKAIHVSLKSVNGKVADISLRLPSNYREKENEMRTLVVQALERGKIDLAIATDKSAAEDTPQINKAVLRNYMEQFRAAAPETVSDDRIFTAASRMPNVIMAEKESMDDSEWDILREAIIQSIQQLQEFRITEGRALQSDLTQRIHSIISLQDKIKPLETERIELLRKRIEKQLDDLIGKDNVDRDRFEQEMIFYLERLDITEENVRLNSHCRFFLETMEAEGSQGKKLNFISQEIGREINTIGSKANHAGIQKLVVEMKDELEKIKEQLQNVL